MDEVLLLRVTYVQTLRIAQERSDHSTQTENASQSEPEGTIADSDGAHTARYHFSCVEVSGNAFKGLSRFVKGL